MSKVEDVAKLREAALVVLRRSGALKDFSGVTAFHATHGSLTLLMRTPFQQMPGPRAPKTYWEAVMLGRLPTLLPYGIDIFAPNKVIAIEWQDPHDIKARVFKRGAWEDELVKAAENPDLLEDTCLEEMRGRSPVSLAVHGAAAAINK